jgi:hypothetical protein
MKVQTGISPRARARDYPPQAGDVRFGSPGYMCFDALVGIVRFSSQAGGVCFGLRAEAVCSGMIPAHTHTHTHS